MTVVATVYNPANTGAAIASTSTVDPYGATRGILDASADTEMGRTTGITIDVHRTHPAASAFTPKRVVRLTDGSGDEVKFRIRKIEDRKIRAGSDGEILRVTGDTLLHDWTRAGIEGHRPPGQEPQPKTTVSYNFCTPGRDMSDFTDSAHFMTRSSSTFSRSAYWPDPYTSAVWTQAEGTHPVGSIFAVRDFTLASAGQFLANITADDGFVPWLEGVQYTERMPRGQELVWYSTWRAIVADLDAGTFRLGVEAKNLGGPGALWVSGWRTDATLLGDPILMTGVDESNPIIGDWKFCAYPSSRPGCPVLMPVVDFLDRAQARDTGPSGLGSMLDWSLGFTATHDSASVAVASAEQGFDLRRHGLDMLDQIALDYATFSVRKGAGLILDAHVTPGVASGETHADDEVDELTRTVTA